MLFYNNYEVLFFYPLQIILSLKYKYYLLQNKQDVRLLNGFLQKPPFEGTQNSNTDKKIKECNKGVFNRNVFSDLSDIPN